MRQACVIGGWTEPRGSRPFLGTLLLGVHDDRGRLQYVGHTGAGFTDAELGRIWKRLQALRSKTSPFAATPSHRTAHWVQPKLVADIRHQGWSANGKLRHPIYTGLIDDTDASPVGRALLGPPREHDAIAPRARRHQASDRATPRSTISKAAIAKLLDQVDAIQSGNGGGALELPGGERLEVSNLGKTFWPSLKLTKGDLFRHYIRVAPYILPVLADRALVMKRYPNGIAAKPFYQHRAPDKIPVGVHVANATSETETRPHLIGGSLLTLLYTVQLASISQDPWFSRIGSEDIADYMAIDLDPPDDLPFARVLDVARWVREELEALKAPGFAKTSGAGGLHVYVPLPPGTPYQASLLFGQIVATMVASKHPKVATVERSLKARGRRIYVDFMQNARGKTLASAYSARASEFAGVSTPVTWDEIDEGVSPKDFTIRNFAGRIESAGDIWAALRKARPADLRAIMQNA
jgi:bifunctional non-homologous end joining protein LigD